MGFSDTFKLEVIENQSPERRKGLNTLNELISLYIQFRKAYETQSKSDATTKRQAFDFLLIMLAHIEIEAGRLNIDFTQHVLSECEKLSIPISELFKENKTSDSNTPYLYTPSDNNSPSKERGLASFLSRVPLMANLIPQKKDDKPNPVKIVTFPFEAKIYTAARIRQAAHYMYSFNKIEDIKNLIAILNGSEVTEQSKKTDATEKTKKAKKNEKNEKAPLLPPKHPIAYYKIIRNLSRLGFVGEASDFFAEFEQIKKHTRTRIFAENSDNNNIVGSFENFKTMFANLANLAAETELLIVKPNSFKILTKRASAIFHRKNSAGSINKKKQWRKSQDKNQHQVNAAYLENEIDKEITVTVKNIVKFEGILNYALELLKMPESHLDPEIEQFLFKIVSFYGQLIQLAIKKGSGLEKLKDERNNYEFAHALVRRIEERMREIEKEQIKTGIVNGENNLGQFKILLNITNLRSDSLGFNVKKLSDGRFRITSTDPYAQGEIVLSVYSPDDPTHIQALNARIRWLNTLSGAESGIPPLYCFRTDTQGYVIEISQCLPPQKLTKLIADFHDADKISDNNNNNNRMPHVRMELSDEKKLQIYQAKIISIMSSILNTLTTLNQVGVCLNNLDLDDISIIDGRAVLSNMRSAGSIPAGSVDGRSKNIEILYRLLYKLISNRDYDPDNTLPMWQLAQRFDENYETHRKLELDRRAKAALARQSLTAISPEELSPRNPASRRSKAASFKPANYKNLAKVQSAKLEELTKDHQRKAQDEIAPFKTERQICSGPLGNIILWLFNRLIEESGLDGLNPFESELIRFLKYKIENENIQSIIDDSQDQSEQLIESSSHYETDKSSSRRTTNSKKTPLPDKAPAPQIDGLEYIAELGRGNYGVVYRYKVTDPQLIAEFLAKGLITHECHEIGVKVLTDKEATEKQLTEKDKKEAKRQADMAKQEFKYEKVIGNILSDKIRSNVATTSAETSLQRTTEATVLPAETRGEVYTPSADVHYNLTMSLPNFDNIFTKIESEGSLHKYLKEVLRKKMLADERDVEDNLKLAFQLIRDIWFGIREIHQKNIRHGDLSLANILVDKLDDENVIARISDFGKARKVEDEKGTDQGIDMQKFDAQLRRADLRRILSDKLSRATDLYGFKILILEVISRLADKPFDDTLQSLFGRVELGQLSNQEKLTKVSQALRAQLKNDTTYPFLANALMNVLDGLEDFLKWDEEATITEAQMDIEGRKLSKALAFMETYIDKIVTKEATYDDKYKTDSVTDPNILTVTRDDVTRDDGASGGYIRPPNIEPSTGQTQKPIVGYLFHPSAESSDTQPQKPIVGYIPQPNLKKPEGSELDIGSTTTTDIMDYGSIKDKEEYQGIISKETTSNEAIEVPDDSDNNNNRSASPQPPQSPQSPLLSNTFFHNESQNTVSNDATIDNPEIVNDNSGIDDADDNKENNNTVAVAGL